MSGTTGDRARAWALGLRINRTRTSLNWTLVLSRHEEARATSSKPSAAAVTEQALERQPFESNSVATLLRPRRPSGTKVQSPEDSAASIVRTWCSTSARSERGYRHEHRANLANPWFGSHS